MVLFADCRLCVCFGDGQVDAGGSAIGMLWNRRQIWLMGRKNCNLIRYSALNLFCSRPSGHSKLDLSLIHFITRAVAVACALEHLLLLYIVCVCDDAHFGCCQICTFAKHITYVQCLSIANSISIYFSANRHTHIHPDSHRRRSHAEVVCPISHCKKCPSTLR